MPYATENRKEPEFEPKQRYAQIHWVERFSKMSNMTYTGDTGNPKRILSTGPLGSVNIDVKDIPTLVERLEFWVESLRMAYRERHNKMLDSSRPGWNEYAMRIARVVALRSLCSRLHVGAALFRHEDHTIVSAGYNAPKNDKPCAEESHGEEGCQASIHAEVNSINNCVRTGDWEDRALYLFVTHEPCRKCAAFIVDCPLQIEAVVFGYYDHRVDGDGLKLLEQNGISVYRFKGM